MAHNSVNPRILITGAAGFTGLHACRHFAAQGWDVIAVSRRPSPFSVLEKGETRICDLQNAEQVKQLVRETSPDYVLHLAGKNSVPKSWQSPAEYMAVNVMAPAYLLEAMRKYRPEGRVLLIGSRLAADPALGPAGIPHPYSLSKLLGSWVAEAWHTLFGQPLLIAEPSNLIGPGESTGFCMLLAKHIVRCERQEPAGIFRISSQRAVRNFLDVRDAVAAYELLLTGGTAGMVYPVASEKERTLGEIAAKLLDRTSAAVQVEWGEAEEPASMQPGRARNQGAASLYQLGWVPRIPLEQTLSEILEYARTKG